MQLLLQFQKNLKLTCTQHSHKNSAYNYTITVLYRGNDKNTKYSLETTKKELMKFHQSLQKYIFELDEPFGKKYIDHEDPTETVDLVNLYLSRVQERIDCLTSRHFVSFFEIDKYLKEEATKILQKEYVQELTEVSISNKDDQVVDFEWEEKNKILFVVSQCKKKKKLQNLFKLLISNDTGLNGTLQMIKFSQKHNQWTKIHTQNIEAEPLKITWNSKSSLLVISTTIGIYVYMVGLGTEKPDMNLIDFVQLPGISSVCIDSQIAQVYVLSNGINYGGKSKLCAYSIKNQSALEIPSKLVKAKSMVFERAHRRLYISEEEGIKIFKVENDSQKIMLENFKRLHTVKHDSDFQEMKLSSEQKPEYLFGYNKKGFVTVFQIKPPEKEFLMSVLTNVQCPGNFTTIEKIWSKKIFCVNYENHLVFISMKNQPLWVKQGGVGTKKIKKVLFDQENERLMYCDNSTLKICEMSF